MTPQAAPSHVVENVAKAALVVGAVAAVAGAGLGWTLRQLGKNWDRGGERKGDGDADGSDGSGGSGGPG